MVAVPDWQPRESAPDASAPLAPSVIRGSLRWPSTAAATAALGAVALLLLDRTQLLPVSIGYALGALLAPALVALHHAREQAARDDVWHVPTRWTARLARAALTVGWLAGTLHALALATELAKR